MGCGTEDCVHFWGMFRLISTAKFLFQRNWDRIEREFDYGAKFIEYQEVLVCQEVLSQGRRHTQEIMRIAIYLCSSPFILPINKN
jgi:hypothetical protein